MIDDRIQAALSGLRAIHDEIRGVLRQPSETIAPSDQPVVPHSLVKGTRGYIEKIVFQVNSCYLATAYDGCAVMMRRLLEVMIIEAFESKGIGRKIKDGNGDYFMLGDLVPITLAESSWTLGRTTKRALGKLKEIGDRSAHSRRYSARREYIDELVSDYRVVVEEFLCLSGMK